MVLSRGGSNGFDDVLTELPKSGQQVGKAMRAKNGNDTHGMGNGAGNGWEWRPSGILLLRLVA